MNNISVKLSYKASGLGGINRTELNTLEQNLTRNYITHIRPNPGPQAGGLVDAFVEVMLDTSFVDFFKVLRDGFIFDTVVRGKKSYLLKPLFDSFKRMEETNRYWDYTSVRFLFNTTEVTIYGMEHMFTSRIGLVFNFLLKHYKNLGEPWEIMIPLRVETNEENKVVYSKYEGDDCTIEAYEGYWGVRYNAGFETMIYNVKELKLFEGDWGY